MAKAYQYTADGYFAGDVEDYGLLPNNATSSAPTFKKGFVPCWDGGKWVQVEDHKGKEGYVDGNSYTIKDYGPLPKGWSDTPPPPSLAEAKTAKQAEINSGFDAALAASLTMPSINTPPSAVEVAVGAAALAAVDADGPAYIMQTHSARRATLMASVDAATTPEAVQAIAVSYAV